jgi:superfamily I DNA/RNA helicase
MIKQKKREMAEQSVKLLTLHASKGLEFDCVFICGVEEGFLPSHASIRRLVVSDEQSETTLEGLKVTIDESNEFQLEEERRLLYVGMTRARKKLFLTYRERIDLGNIYIYIYMYIHIY